MEATSEESEAAVFRSLVSKVTSPEHQFHVQYYSDGQLKDRLLSAIDIPVVREEIRDRAPRTSHQLINRVIHHLWTKKRTAGTIVAHLAATDYDVDEEDIPEGMSLSESCGGDAKHTIIHQGLTTSDDEVADPPREEGGYLVPIGCAACAAVVGQSPAAIRLMFR